LDRGAGDCRNFPLAISIASTCAAAEQAAAKLEVTSIALKSHGNVKLRWISPLRQTKGPGRVRHNLTFQHVQTHIRTNVGTDVPAGRFKAVKVTEPKDELSLQ